MTKDIEGLNCASLECVKRSLRGLYKCQSGGQSIRANQWSRGGGVKGYIKGDVVIVAKLEITTPPAMSYDLVFYRVPRWNRNVQIEDVTGCLSETMAPPGDCALQIVTDCVFAVRERGHGSYASIPATINLISRVWLLPCDSVPEFEGDQYLARLSMLKLPAQRVLAIDPREMSVLDGLPDGFARSKQNLIKAVPGVVDCSGKVLGDVARERPIHHNLADIVAGLRIMLYDNGEVVLVSEQLKGFMSLSMIRLGPVNELLGNVEWG